MEDFYTNEIKIADYLSGRMNMAEQRAFIKELGENEVLRKQYEDELLMEDLLGEQEVSTPEVDMMFQPADAHLAMLEEALGKFNRQGEEANSNPVVPDSTQGVSVDKTRVVPLVKRFRLIAAAAAIIILAAPAFWLVNRQSQNTGVITKKNAADSPAVARIMPPKDTLKAVYALPTHTVNADSLYTLNAVKYQGADLPVQVSIVVNDYNAGNYTAVTKTTEADIMQAGVSDEEAVAAQYLHLYKGLAYLPLGKPEKAIGEFDTVLKTADSTDKVYYTAEWYKALARLKTNSPEKAAAIATHITKTASPYKNKAIALLKGLE
jgi:tetratricopeptide (TPR) repeat protein